ncbi:hypothetical protein D3C73_983810 [compost metagenome]
MQGRITRLTQVINTGAQCIQGVRQIADGPFVHARHARQAVVAPHERQRGSQRAYRRARVAHEKVSAFHRKTPHALDSHTTRIQFGHLHAQLAQRAQHDARIVGIQQPGNGGGALGNRRQQQHAIGNALGTRQGHHALRLPHARQVQIRQSAHVSYSFCQLRRA